MNNRHLLFEASGLALATPARFVSTVHDHLPIQPVVGTRHWFRGLAVAKGKLLPITNLGGFCGLPLSDGQILEVSAAVGLGGLQVDRVLGLSTLSPVDMPLDEEKLLAACEKTPALITRAIVHQDCVHWVLDVSALMQSPFFLTIAETDL